MSPPTLERVEQRFRPEALEAFQDACSTSGLSIATMSALAWKPPPARIGSRIPTLGLLFVNLSIGGTLTHFAAPPMLMVARTWNWDTPFNVGDVRLACGDCGRSFNPRLLRVLQRGTAGAGRTAGTSDVASPTEEAPRHGYGLLSGQALPGRFFDGAVHPLWLLCGAAVPTLIAAGVFRLL